MGNEARPLESEYEATRSRIVELVGADGTADQIDVPACPGWSVKDVVAHVTGNCADVLIGNLAGVATPEWTAAQVEARREWKLGDVLAEWDEVGPKFAAMLDDFPGHYGRQSVADLCVHEHDLRGALGSPGERDSDTVALATDFAMTVVVGTCARVAGLGPLEVRADTQRWIVGTGDAVPGDDESWWDAVAADAPPPSSEKEPVGTLTAGTFELFRAITGRRSASQIRKLDWSIDPEPFLPLFGHGPFVVRDTDLEE